jgi:ankyrin repeat protein
MGQNVSRSKLTKKASKKSKVNLATQQSEAYGELDPSRADVQVSARVEMSKNDFDPEQSKVSPSASIRSLKNHDKSLPVTNPTEFFKPEKHLIGEQFYRYLSEDEPEKAFELIEKNEVGIKKKEIDISNMFNDHCESNILMACAFGHVGLVHKLIDIGVSIEQIDPFTGNNVVLWACRLPSELIIVQIRTMYPKTKLFIQCNQYQQTPLIVACQLGYESIAMKLLDNDVVKTTLYHHDKFDLTAFYYACVKKMTKVLYRILEIEEEKKTESKMDGLEIVLNTNLVPTNDVLSISPEKLNHGAVLAWACQYDLFDVALKYLNRKDMSNDPYINHINGDGRTPLMLACMKKQTGIALKILDKYNVDVDTFDNNGDSALSLACKNNLNDVVIKIVNKYPGASSLATQGVNTGNTPLIWLCMNKMSNTILHCLENKAIVGSVNAINHEDNTALLICVAEGLDRVAEKLMENGADPMISIDRYILQHACKNKMDKVCMKILQNGVTAKLLDEQFDGDALKCEDIAYDDTELIKDLGIKVGPPCSNNNSKLKFTTVLLLACKNKMHEVACIIIDQYLKAGSYYFIAQKDYTGRKPIDYANEFYLLDVIQKLDETDKLMVQKTGTVAFPLQNTFGKKN